MSTDIVELIAQAQADAESWDPHAIADAVARAVPPRDVRDCLHQLVLRSLLGRTNGPNGSGGPLRQMKVAAGRSRWEQASTWWKSTLNVWVSTGVPGERARFGDLTAAQVDAIAGVRDRQSADLARERDRYRAMAGLMRRLDVARVADLPESEVMALWTT